MVPGRSGLPTLLNGLIGSMTHCNSYCAAAVAPSQVCNAIGIDAEPNRGVTPGVLDRIASSTKCEHVHYLRALHPHISFDRLLFSSKESIYKAVFSNSGDSLRFKDVRVLANPNSNFDTQITSSHLRCASLQVILGTIVTIHLIDLPVRATALAETSTSLATRWKTWAGLVNTLFDLAESCVRRNIPMTMEDRTKSPRRLPQP